MRLPPPRRALLPLLAAPLLLAAAWPDAVRELYRVLAADGREELELIAPPRTAELADEGFAVLVLREPGEHTLAGACDADCRDIDLWVYDAAGAVVARDADPRADPVVDVVVRAGAPLRAHVRMVSCAAQGTTWTSILNQSPDTAPIRGRSATVEVPGDTPVTTSCRSAYSARADAPVPDRSPMVA